MIELEPNFDYAYYALALAQEKDGNFEGAISNYQEFLKISGNSNLKQEVKTKIEELIKSKLEVKAEEE